MGCQISSSQLVKPQGLAAITKAGMSDKACDPLDLSECQMHVPATHHVCARPKEDKKAVLRKDRHQFFEDDLALVNESTNLHSKKSERFIINKKRKNNLSTKNANKNGSPSKQRVSPNKQQLRSCGSELFVERNRTSLAHRSFKVVKSPEIEAQESQMNMEVEFRKTLSECESLHRAELDVSQSRRASKSRDVLKKSCFNFSSHNNQRSDCSLERNPLRADEGSDCKSASRNVGQRACKSGNLQPSGFGNLKLNNLLKHSPQDISHSKPQALEVRVNQHKRVCSNQLTPQENSNKEQSLNTFMVKSTPKLGLLGRSCRVLTLKERNLPARPAILSVLKKKTMAPQRISPCGSAEEVNGSVKRQTGALWSPKDTAGKDELRDLLAITSNQRHRVLVKVGDAVTPSGYQHQSVRCVVLKQGIAVRPLESPKTDQTQ